MRQPAACAAVGAPAASRELEDDARGLRKIGGAEVKEGGTIEDGLWGTKGSEVPGTGPAQTALLPPEAPGTDFFLSS